MSDYKKILKQDLNELVGKRYVPDEEEDQFQDFPYIEDPEPFTTYRPMEMKILEQTPEEIEAAPGPVGRPPGGGGEMGGEMPAGAGEEYAGGEYGMGMGPGGMPFPGESMQTLTSSEIGRVYELKKIYSRLTSVETYLTDNTDKSLAEMRRYVSQAINLFEVVISNVEQFKDKIDPIIVTFYEFVDMVYAALRKYHKAQAREED